MTFCLLFWEESTLPKWFLIFLLVWLLHTVPLPDTPLVDVPLADVLQPDLPLFDVLAEVPQSLDLEPMDPEVAE